MPFAVYAQVTLPGAVSNTTVGNLPPYTPLEPLPLPAGIQSGQATFGAILDSFFSLSIAAGGMLAVGMLVWYGITYMLSEAVNMKASARRHLEGVFWGLLLLIGSWLILNTINPQLVNSFSVLNVGGSTPSTNTTTPNPQSTNIPSAANLNSTP